MGDLYHNPPSIVIYSGSEITQHDFQLVSGAGIRDVVLESRVGLFGGLISRAYVIHPPLPETIRKDPDKFLTALASSLKIDNFEKDHDLWIYSLWFHRDDLNLPPVLRRESLALWEKMLHGLDRPSRLYFDITSSESSRSCADFYEVDPFTKKE